MYYFYKSGDNVCVDVLLKINNRMMAINHIWNEIISESNNYHKMEIFALIAYEMVRQSHLSKGVYAAK